MSRRLLLVIALFITAVSAGCAPSTPLWREQARAVLDSARREGVDTALPAEFDSTQECFNRGEAILRDDEVEEADQYFRLAWLKGEILEKNYAAEKVRRAEEERRIRQEELEAQKQRAILAGQHSLTREKVESAEARAKVERSKQAKERQQQTHHTVKRGETLPLIAAQPEVYNDYRLWPLLYRANRDQISNPKLIWPGQILRIPRNVGRDEIAEARRYAQEKPI